MGRKRDDIFVIGVEPLDAEPAGGPGEEPSGEPRRRNPFAAAPQPAAERPAGSSARRAPRALAALALCGGALAVLGAFALGGGEEEPADPLSSLAPPLPVAPTPAPAPQLSPAEARPRFSRRERRDRAARARPGDSDRPRRAAQARPEPAAEISPSLSPEAPPAPAAPPAPTPRPASQTPPAAPSPPPGTAERPPARPEFGIER